jgi:hypothetical protein
MANNAAVATSASDKELRELDRQLLEAFTTKEKNTIHINTFVRFAPLFTEDVRGDWNDLPKHVKELATAYRNVVDPYLHTEIVDDGGNVLFELPQIFLPIPSLDMTNPNTTAQVIRNRNVLQSPQASDSAMTAYLHTFITNVKDEPNIAKMIAGIMTTKRIAAAATGTSNSSDGSDGWDYVE